MTRFLLPLLLSLLVAPAATRGAAPAGEVSFQREVAPILLRRCVACHGERMGQGGYRAHTFQDLLRAGKSGRAPVLAGKPDASYLYQLLTTANAAKRMPLGGETLPAAETAAVRRWIQAGARFDGADARAALAAQQGPRRHPAAPARYRSPLPVTALALAPDGRLLATAGYHEVLLWETATGRLLRRVAEMPQRIHALAFAADGASLLVAGGTPGEYGEVALVDPAAGRRLRVLDTLPDLALTANFSADGRLVVVGGADASVRVLQAADGRRRWYARLQSDWVTSVGCSPDGRFVASTSRDKTVKVFTAETGELFTTYTGHNRQLGTYKGQFPIYALAFDLGGAALTAGGGRWIQIWEPEKAREETGTAADMEDRFSRPGHARYLEHGFQREVFALAVRDGQVFAASADGEVRQFELAARRLVRRFQGHQDWVYALDAVPAASLLATGSYDGEVRLWDLATGSLRRSFTASPGFETVPKAPPAGAGTAPGR